jgi:hypothetical protein
MKVSRLVLVLIVAGVSTLAFSAPAYAACGNNINFYTSSDNAWQKLVYSNCTGKSVRRKAIVNNWADGNCITIPAHSSKTLLNIRYYGWNAVTHTRSC